jgi:hypothetical protein
VSGGTKRSAREAFDLNIKDAAHLVLLAESLQNTRVRRMRRERRETLGEILGIPRRDRDELDCVESADLFTILRPKSRLSRESFEEASLRPLLRQALVAACAALETFVGDRVMELYRGALDAEERPPRLLDLPMTVDDWLWIDENYTRKRWGLREVVEFQVRRIASPSPRQIGAAFGIVGEKKLWQRVDKQRGVKTKASEEVLERIYARRNQIAHTGDRVGRGRANLSAEEVNDDLACVVEVVDAISAVTGI